ncbi:DUF1758 domain-containing protein [Trichonephila clavipes]|nr:DUF1758 domain-containing protein [Trichonephila clavipes]
MSRSGGQSETKLLVFSPQASLVLIYRPTEGMKGWIDLDLPEDRTQDLCYFLKISKKLKRIETDIWKIVLKLRIERLQENAGPSEADKRKFKVPKIELKKFNGDSKEFLAFWSQFKKIHDDSSIAEEDKMQYLLQSVEPHSKAESLVLSFPTTAANYLKAIEQLKERFRRDDLLVQIYVRDLLGLVMKNAVKGRSKTDLTYLYDELEGKLRALESLGRTQEKYGDFLIPLVESCLPEETLLAWERSQNHESTQNTRSLQRCCENISALNGSGVE